MKLFSPSGRARCAVPRLTVPFCAMLTALLLLTCASAQAQWTLGNTYYGVSTVTSVTSNTTPTKTASAGTAAMGLVSVTSNDQNGYRAAGNIYGYAYQDFIWNGPSPQPNLQVGITESDSGSGVTAQSTVDQHSDATNPPYVLSYTGTYPRVFGVISMGGGSVHPVTSEIWLSVQTTAYYPNSASATAKLTWGNPIVSP